MLKIASMITGPLLLLTAACGGDATTIDEPRVVAAEMGCSASFVPGVAREDFVKDAGRCTVQGVTVPLYTFENEEAARTFVRAHVDPDTRFVRGETWAVEIPPSVDPAYVTEKLGGEIVQEDG